MPTIDWRIQGDEDKQVNPQNRSMLSFLGKMIKAQKIINEMKLTDVLGLDFGCGEVP